MRRSTATGARSSFGEPVTSSTDKLYDPRDAKFSFFLVLCSFAGNVQHENTGIDFSSRLTVSI